jgi:hypothetical protein
MNGSDDTYALYLKDLIHLAKESARQAKLRVDNASGDERTFQSGVLMGWYSIISLMQSQATAFDIPLDTLGLDDIDPDRDLV